MISKKFLSKSNPLTHTSISIVVDFQSTPEIIASSEVVLMRGRFGAQSLDPASAISLAGVAASMRGGLGVDRDVPG